MSYQLITEVNNIQTSETDWWMIYDPVNLDVISSPMQCSGYTSSPHNMVIADSEAELLAYIEENGLIIPLEDPELT
tara:strand:- start:752 stop:979 length:228 start_codon:yes stop_codon:yes gene_type:complete